ncbi:hypothetical protein [Vibrio sp. ER1A]|nr:hypothetical protein [Vibrio sp. ER1A]
MGYQTSQQYHCAKSSLGKTEDTPGPWIEVIRGVSSEPSWLSNVEDD